LKENIMDVNQQMRSLVENLDTQHLASLGQEIARILEERRPKVSTEEITPSRMRDPEFAARVRAEVESALKNLG
jgi:endo-1,4-beta-mannosidase